MWMTAWPANETVHTDGSGYKCLPVIDGADKTIHGSNEVLANSL